MAVERLTVSVDAELAAAMREAANQDALNMSAWLANAARRQLAVRGLAAAISDWEIEHGEFTDDELDRARERLAQ